MDELRSICDLASAALVSPARAVVRAEELWRELLAGRYVVVAVTEHAGRRYLLMRRSRADEIERACLSRREREVAIHGARGASVKEIAISLDLAPSTVCAHLGSAMRKLGLRDRTELMALHSHRQCSECGSNK